VPPAVELQGRNTYLSAELRAGVVAFLTICYIIAVSDKAFR
jgi:xanthine/uracil/vitamin C permease (AzgA family)